jgi:nicotinamide-nucleotide amidase
VNAEIIAIGSELLTPRRVDTNSLYLTEKLNQAGFEVVRKTIVGDDRARLADELRQARGASDLVITTGGIGPTLDDLTREAASDALGRGLVFEPSIVAAIEERFKRFGRKMAEINKRQAYVLEGAEILPNPNGTAPGQYLHDEQGILIILPGPPRELEPMFEEQCLPRLLKLESPDQYHTATLRIALLPESEVDERIGPIYSAEPRVATTILAAPGDIQVHLRAKAPTVDEARLIAEALSLKVEAELGKPVYARSNEELVEVVARIASRRRSRRSAYRRRRFANTACIARKPPSRWRSRLAASSTRRWAWASRASPGPMAAPPRPPWARYSSRSPTRQARRL